MIPKSRSKLLFRRFQRAFWKRLAPFSPTVPPKKHESCERVVIPAVTVSSYFWRQSRHFPSCGWVFLGCPCTLKTEFLSTVLSAILYSVPGKPKLFCLFYGRLCQNCYLSSPLPLVYSPNPPLLSLRSIFSLLACTNDCEGRWACFLDRGRLFPL